MKIGCDIVKVSRIEKSVENSRFVERVFSAAEREYCKTAENFAGLYAAKEAYLKALGTGIDRDLAGVEISHLENGKPFLKGVENSDLSISHDGDYAIAAVILW